MKAKLGKTKKRRKDNVSKSATQRQQKRAKEVSQLQNEIRMNEWNETNEEMEL